MARTLFERQSHERQEYPRRIVWSMAISLVLLIVAFRFWPVPEIDTQPVVFDTRAQEMITLEEIQPTRQQRGAPAPRPPAIPVLVPDDVVLPDVELDFSQDFALSVLGSPTGTADDAPLAAPGGGGSAPGTRPDSGPRPVRIVEPEYTEAARRRKVRAEVIVEVLVDTKGRVTTSRISERFLVRDSDTGARESVATLGYGLEEAAIAAAGQWTFRPARQDGRAVESWTTITFTFGL